jgi:hypothetical protein
MKKVDRNQYMKFVRKLDALNQKYSVSRGATDRYRYNVESTLVGNKVLMEYQIGYYHTGVYIALCTQRMPFRQAETFEADEAGIARYEKFLADKHEAKEAERSTA